MLLHWQIGQRIGKGILGEKRAEYGKEIVATLSRQLRFTPGDVGQMEFYLRWLKNHETRPGEEEPLGLILCAEKSDERVEVFELANRGIRVAEYLTELPPKEVLEHKLHEVVRLAQTRLERRGGLPRKSAKRKE